MTRAILLAAWLFAWAGGALAHKASDSYYRLDIQGEAVTGQLDLALRDLDFALTLDADDDGTITWGEVRGKREALVAWALQGLTIERGGACTLEVGALMVDSHTDGAYAVLPLSGQCPAGSGALTLGYRLLFEQDALHRGLLNLTLDGATQSAVFGPEQSRQTFQAGPVSRWTAFKQYVVEGIWHIWLGFDHVLFLLSLLLPAVLTWRAKQKDWQPAASFRPAFMDVLRIVTAFTLAHSVTLSLAALGLVSLPSRWVESTIAASVLLAALNNLWPLVGGRRWVVAFGFGLIHGFGFASVLADLGLPQDALVLALVGFNLGVELGQLAIVLAFLPLAYALRGSLFYRRGVLVAGSVLIAVIASAWFLERAFQIPVFPA